MDTAQTVDMKQRLAIAAGAALLVAGLILVTCVLPAEFAIDPLGTGAKLGYILRPPGWSHDGSSLTAGALHKKLGLR